MQARYGVTVIKEVVCFRSSELMTPPRSDQQCMLNFRYLHLRLNYQNITLYFTPISLIAVSQSPTLLFMHLSHRLAPLTHHSLSALSISLFLSWLTTYLFLKSFHCRLFQSQDWLSRLSPGPFLPSSNVFFLLKQDTGLLSTTSPNINRFALKDSLVNLK